VPVKYRCAVGKPLRFSWGFDERLRRIVMNFAPCPSITWTKHRHHRVNKFAQILIIQKYKQKARFLAGLCNLADDSVG
jgi:hypothetical protein